MYVYFIYMFIAISSLRELAVDICRLYSHVTEGKKNGGKLLHSDRRYYRISLGGDSCLVDPPPTLSIMNVAALLQDSPSEDTNNRRRAQDNASQRTWNSSPSLQQQQPLSTSTSSQWGPSSGIHDRPSAHWQERLPNPTLVGPGTGVPPSPYIHSGALLSFFECF